MKPPILIIVTVGLTLTASIASASGPTTPEQKHLQPSAPRTITVSEADTPPVVCAGLLQSTLILLPDQEKVANVFAGDTVDWVFDGGHVASRFISIKPKDICGRSPKRKENLLNGVAQTSWCSHLSGLKCDNFIAGPYGNRRPEPKHRSVLIALDLYRAFRSRLIDSAPYHPFDLQCVYGAELNYATAPTEA